jgi:hypothetical protein
MYYINVSIYIYIYIYIYINRVKDSHDGHNKHKTVMININKTIQKSSQGIDKHKLETCRKKLSHVSLYIHTDMYAYIHIRI